MAGTSAGTRKLADKLTRFHVENMQNKSTGGKAVIKRLIAVLLYVVLLLGTAQPCLAEGLDETALVAHVYETTEDHISDQGDAGHDARDREDSAYEGPMPAEDMGDGISQAVLAGTKTGYADDTIAGSADDAPEAVAEDPEEGDLESAVDDPGDGDPEGAADATGDDPAAEQMWGFPI